MPELSVDEERYLLAAFSEMPQDWFHPQALGQKLSLSSQESESIAQTLVVAGMLIANPGCHARLTEPGRKEAMRLASLNRRAAKRGRRIPGMDLRVAAVAWLAVVACAVIAFFWFAKVF